LNGGHQALRRELLDPDDIYPIDPPSRRRTPDKAKAMNLIDLEPQISRFTFDADTGGPRRATAIAGSRTSPWRQQDLLISDVLAFFSEPWSEMPEQTIHALSVRMRRRPDHRVRIPAHPHEFQ
jgi:hypothetical protein